MYIFDAPLKRWFSQLKRKLPWREATSPYRVWVSEVMLQQTQVNTVIPYFHRWMERFPSIKDLSNADVDTVLKAWEGLGYYARARHLHKGAQFVVHRFQAKLPEDQKKLLSIPGIGSYTAGAILSFAFKRRFVAVDSNVLRVIARFFALPFENTLLHKKVEALLWDILPKNQPYISMEALIELGALVCKKVPLCVKCPLNAHCSAYKTKATHIFPFKKKRFETTVLHRLVAIIDYKESILLKQQTSGLMKGLWELPYIDTDIEQIEKGEAVFMELFSLPMRFMEKWPCISHTFTRYKAILYPYRFRASTHQLLQECTWVKKLRLSKCAFPAGHRTLVHKWETQPTK